MDASKRRIGLLHCNLCYLRSNWLVILSRYLRQEGRVVVERTVRKPEMEFLGCGFLPSLLAAAAPLEK